MAAMAGVRWAEKIEVDGNTDARKRRGQTRDELEEIQMVKKRVGDV